VVPIEVTARVGASLVPEAKLEVYSGAPLGLTATHREQLNADLLSFLEKLDRSK
jgi:non-heme chloroperoxidase